MGNLTLNGSTSGGITIAPPAVAGTNTITLPASTGTVALTASPTFSGTLTATTITSPSATALTIQSAGTTAMTVSTSQNVGIGTTTPNTRLQVYKAAASAFTGTSAGALLLTDSTNTLDYFTSIDFNTTNSSSVPYARIGMSYTSGGSTLSFGTSNSYGSGITNTAMTIDPAGNLLVGTTSISNARLVVYGNSTTAQTVYASSSNAIGINNTSGTATYNGLVFSNNGGSSFVASVQVFASSVAYNTSSDARLKDNVQDAELALGLVNQIKVRQFNWKNTGEHQRYGMVAQELQNIAPEFVNDQLDKDHTLGIDYSKMAPMLIKAIQELSAKNDALEAANAAFEARLAALETK